MHKLRDVVKSHDVLLLLQLVVCVLFCFISTFYFYFLIVFSQQAAIPWANVQNYKGWSHVWTEHFFFFLARTGLSVTRHSFSIPFNEETSAD